MNDRMGAKRAGGTHRRNAPAGRIGGAHRLDASTERAIMKRERYPRFFLKRPQARRAKSKASRQRPKAARRLKGIRCRTPRVASSPIDA